MRNGHNTLKFKNLGIDTYKEAVIYMRRDCQVCRAEGFEVHARVQVIYKYKKILATLNIIEDGILQNDEVGLSIYASKLLDVKEGEILTLTHPKPLDSLSHVRSKIYGHALSSEKIESIVHDISKGSYTDIHVAAFLTACAGGRLSLSEINDLTRAMVMTGERLEWPNELVVDKHCVGGLPGNRTTLIIVPIVTAFGLMMPKTSSRAITSPAGTADVMEVLAPVNLSVESMRKVVEKEKGCIAWGGSVNLSPADEILIRVERVIDLDSEGQMIASVLSKKIAAGSTYILIDMPVGPTAKIRSQATAENLKSLFEEVANAIGISVVVHFSEGLAPVGRGIGPVLEAKDILSVLQGDPNAPQDLRKRALTLAGEILEFSPKVEKGQGFSLAEELLDSGQAWQKFQKICDAQGGMREPTEPAFSHVVTSSQSGKIVKIDNRNIARLAKLAGAPNDKAAGILLHANYGDTIEKGQPLFTIFSEFKGELEYAKTAFSQMPDMMEIK